MTESLEYAKSHLTVENTFHLNSAVKALDAKHSGSS